MPRGKIALVAATAVATTALVCVAFLVAFSIGATTTVIGERDHFRFDLTESSSSEPFYMKGTWVCYLEGNFDTSSVSLEKLKGSAGSSGRQVNIVAFDGAVVDVDDLAGMFGSGLYQWVVTGGTPSTSIEADCADANP